MAERVDAIVVGAGLAGLSCGWELAQAGRDVLLLEARDVVGGRTASWNEQGMLVESGLHRFLGFYSALPRLLRAVGVDPDEIVCWEDEIEIRSPDGGPSGVLGVSPLHKPLRTIGGVLGNTDLLPPADKAALAVCIAAGLKDYLARPNELDQQNVRDYARRYGVSDGTIERVLWSLTAGIFFVPPERYSAYNFFGLLAPYLHRLHELRLGAFMGGMTDVMAGPIAAGIERQGGRVRTRATVDRLHRAGDRVAGVVVAGEVIAARDVVVATSLGAAQDLLGEPFGSHPWFGPMFRLPSMPAATIQFELSAPATPVDRTSFAPQTVLAAFSEQSRTTFRHAPGRFSVILTPPESFLDQSPEAIREVVCADADRLGIPLADLMTDYRVVHHPRDFHSLEPGYQGLRPAQATPIPGLALAGDYTHQRFLATMEGAVVSGRRAAAAVLNPAAH